MYLKKILCFALAAVMLTSSFVSCTDRGDEDTKKPAVSGTNREDDADEYEFSNETFDGAEFKILHYGDTAKDFHDAYIWADSMTGGAIGDAVADRNRLVEEQYDVVIAAEECNPMDEALRRQQAGQCDYDLIYEWGSRSVSAALDGQLYDFREIDGLDFEKSWWAPKASESLTIADRMFIATNMISMNSVSWAGMQYFNKALMDKLNFDYPYDYVQSNTWTCDVMLDMMNGAEEDVNGDGEMTIEDQYGGFGVDLSGILYAAPSVTQENDGSYTVIGYTEQMVARYNQYSRILSTVSSSGYEDFFDEVDTTVDPSIHIAVRKTVFGEDHALFMSGSIDMTKEQTNMKSDYGVVPNPKADPNDEWTAIIDRNAPMFSVPIQVEDPDMLAIVMDYMAYESERILLPAYYETTIKTKRMEDTRDYEMLDIIRENASYGGFGGIYWGVGCRDKMFASGNFASVWARYGKQEQAGLNDLIDTFETIDYVS